MPFHHSAFNASTPVKEAIGCGIYPLRGKSTGPAPAMDPASEEMDIIDEALYYFRANVLYKSITLSGPADRVLLYLTDYISQCIKKVAGSPDAKSAKKTLHALAMDSFSAPGEGGFSYSAFYPANQATPSDVKLWKEYMLQLRSEASRRLVDRLWQNPQPDGSANKLWMSYAKINFLAK